MTDLAIAATTQPSAPEAGGWARGSAVLRLRTTASRSGSRRHLVGLRALVRPDHDPAGKRDRDHAGQPAERAQPGPDQERGVLLRRHQADRSPAVAGTVALRPGAARGLAGDPPDGHQPDRGRPPLHAEARGHGAADLAGPGGRDRLRVAVLSGQVGQERAPLRSLPVPVGAELHHRPAADSLLLLPDAHLRRAQPGQPGGHVLRRARARDPDLRAARGGADRQPGSRVRRRSTCWWPAPAG